jgi:hypothetical protein
MPVVFRSGAFTYFFYSNEGTEPVHIHVRKGDARSPGAVAKYWLDPLRCEYREGLNAAEVRRVEREILQNESRIRSAWDDHFGG